ncbi:MAG: hypothetical protein WD771_04985 [Gemmatimonadaceae bacterium]
MVGELLAAEGEEFSIVILGGAALNLLGLVSRTTDDVDIVAFAGGGADRARLSEPPTPMPEPLVRAARTVARDLGLGEDWLNTGPALQWRTGLPPGLGTRVQWQQHAALWVGIVARYDLLFFKLFAAADSAGPASVHYKDLLAMAPTASELAAAGTWVRTQDASAQFGTTLDHVLASVRSDLGIT